MRKILHLLLLISSAIASAQDGTIDYSFNPATGAENGNVNSTAVQADGKIIVGGDFSQLNNVTCNKLGRLNADGTLDLAFTLGSGFDGTVNAIAVQPDGKIVVAGAFTTYNGNSQKRIVRLNADGTIDTGFLVGTGTNNTIYAATVQSDGKIILVGDFTIFNGTSKNKIVRLNADGTIDPSFSALAGANSTVYTCAVQADGKILLGGDFTTFSSTPRNMVARLNSDGTIDTTFVSTNAANAQVRVICAQPDGRIVIGGYFTSYNGTPANYIARLNADSTLDATFNSGSAFNNAVFSIARQTDGKLIVGGIFTSYNSGSCNRIARINANGTADTTFTTGTAPGADAAVNSVAVQSNGKILLVGSFLNCATYLRNKIARLNADGSLDTGFYPYFIDGVSANAKVSKIALQPDGKMIIVGSFTNYNGIQSNRIARLNADGTLDATFNVGTGANLGISKVVILPNGKVIIGGDFTTVNNIAINRIARLNSDGSLDTTFNTGGAGANASVQSLAVQADGKILVGGGFYNFNGVAVTTPLVRLNANGTIDSSFNMGLGTDGGTVLGLAVQPDGKIILVGGSSTFNNVVVGYIVRVNPNGSVDPTWNPGGTGANYFLYSVKLQADGKILITGDFTSYNGQACRNFVRLNSNGTLDTTFNCTTLAGGPLNVSVIQNDGKYIIGGSCTPYNGFTGKGIMRLNTDGSLDTTLIQGTGFDTFVSDLALQPDGKIIVGGGFISYNGVTRKYITRLNGSAILGVNEFNSADKVSVYPNPVTDYLKFDLHENITAKSFEVYDVAGKKVHSGDLQENQIDVSAYTSGIYFLHLKTADGMLSAKFMKI